MKPDTKQRLIEVGTEAVMAKSYDGVGINHVLELAGVPKGSFYHHFRSKEEFGVAMVDHTVAEHQKCLRQMLLEGDGSPLARLRAYYEWGRDKLRDQGTDRRCLIAKMALDLASLSDPIKQAIQRGFDSLGETLSECLRQAQQAGELDPDEDVDRLADFLTASWEGVMVRLQVDRDLTVIDEFLDLMFDRVLVRRGS